MKRSFLCVLILPFMMSCEDVLVIDATEVNTIVYQFTDSSVPPKYHRSYNIEVTTNSIHFKVDSYGDLLAEESIELAPNVFNDLIQIINAAQLVSTKTKAEQGCTGGKTERLMITSSDKLVYVGDFDHCGGLEIPEKAGDVEKVVQTIKGLIPNFHDYLK